MTFPGVVFPGGAYITYNYTVTHRSMFKYPNFTGMSGRTNYSMMAQEPKDAMKK